MIHGCYAYSYLETLATWGFQENLKNFEQHLSNNDGIRYALFPSSYQLIQSSNLSKKRQVIARIAN